MPSAQEITAAWKIDREDRERRQAETEAEADRYRGALRRIARSDPGSYFGRIADEALRTPDPDLAALDEWGGAGL